MPLASRFDDNAREPKKTVVVRPMNGRDDDFLIGVLQSYTTIAGEHALMLKNAMNTDMKNIMVAIKSGTRIPCGFIWRYGNNDTLMYHHLKNASQDVPLALIRGLALLTLSEKGTGSNLYITVPTIDIEGHKALLSLGSRMASTDHRGTDIITGRQIGLVAHIGNLDQRFTKIPGPTPL